MSSFFLYRGLYLVGSGPSSVSVGRAPGSSWVLVGVRGVSGGSYFVSQPSALCLLALPREIHLERQCASEGPVKGVAREGEFHEVTESASGVLLTGVASTGEIHLENQCASECPVEGVRL